MQLKNEFEVATAVEQAWELLTDLERIAPCMPGAHLDNQIGKNYHGSVKIKVGPIGAHFQGTAHFAARDDNAHSAVIIAGGKDPRGQATATAQISARLEPMSAARTRVVIDTDLDLTGPFVQFGRGSIADVSNRLLRQFASNLAELLATSDSNGRGMAASSSAAAPALEGDSASTPRSRPPSSSTSGGASQGAELDVMSLIVPMIKERYGQALLGAFLGFALSWLVFGRKARSQQARHTS